MVLESTLFGSDAWSRSMMSGELADKHSYYLVAVPVGEPHRIVGYAGVRAPRAEPQSDIQTIGVAVDARRQGLGRVFMLRLIDEARDRGAREVFLEVRADNPAAQALYDSLGFEQIAVRAKYYQPDGVDAHVMRLTIPSPQVRPA